MAKFKEKYIDTIICDQLGSFINGPAAAYEICDMAVQITKGKVYVPEGEAFPDEMKVEFPEDKTQAINVEVTFDETPTKEKVRVVAADCMTVSEPAVSNKKVTFTVTPKAEAKDTYTNVVVFYGNYTRVFHVDLLEEVEAQAPEKPATPEVDGIKKSDADVHVGETFNITVSVDKAIENEADLTIETDDKIEEVEPFTCIEGNMRLKGLYKAVKGGTSVVTAYVTAGKVKHQLEIEIAGEAPEPPVEEEAEISSVTASPETIAVGADSTITVNFQKRQ